MMERIEAIRFKRFVKLCAKTVADEIAETTGMEVVGAEYLGFDEGDAALVYLMDVKTKEHVDRYYVKARPKPHESGGWRCTIKFMVLHPPIMFVGGKEFPLICPGIRGVPVL